ncbi:MULTISPECIES: glycosyltransferase family 2 protein [Streptomyces]|uniref:glycosyltransferase family 2 protein n=1 Tax=Streptomyces TaxID=1883 RepID=UPI001CEF744A|nr:MULTISPECIES: glycosyltransferase family 2 protein [Streptomyces]
MTDLLVPTRPLHPYAVHGVPPGWRPTRRLTVLTPLYRESAATFERSARAVAALDYPDELLQVLWLVEAGGAGDEDAARADAAMAAYRRAGLDWRLVRLPEMSPKGAALNHAFPYAGGEVIAVLDADVVPAPGQAAEAVLALERGHALVQAEEISEPGAGLAARAKAGEDAVWHASVRGLKRLAGVHVVAGSSVYAWASTWDLVRPVRSDDVEESYHWSLELMGAGVATGFLASASRVSATERPAAALRQRARWTRGQLRAVAVNWRGLPPRGRLLGAVTVGSLAVRAALPVVCAGAFAVRALRPAALLLVLADTACVLGARRDADYRRRTDTAGWVLVVPWHLLGSVAVYLALYEWARGRRGWHSVRDDGGSPAPVPVEDAVGRTSGATDHPAPGGGRRAD